MWVRHQLLILVRPCVTEKERKNNRWKKTNTNIGHIKFEVKDKKFVQGKQLLHAQKDIVLFVLFDQGQRIWICLYLEQQEVVMRVTEVGEGAVCR